MSIMEVIGFFYPECKGIKYLEEEDCKFLIIMDSFDCYKAPLDWENTPVIKDNHTRAHTDVLIVNVIRGTVLSGARVWILGRHAAVSQIPCQYIDVVTEIQGFSDEMKDDYFTKRFHDEELARKIVTHYKRLPMLIALARQPFVCWVVATVFERYYRCRSYGLHPPRLTPFYINVLIYQTNRRLQIYDGKGADDLKWFSEDKQLLLNMGKMAFKMLERKTRVFYEADMNEFGLKLTEVAVFSGICTEELLTADTDGRRTFRFIHFSFQEFMAALYVFIVFRCDSQNVLGSSMLAKLFKPKDQIKSTQSLVQCAVERTLWPPLGHYDMFLRFLCGLLSPQCHNKLLCGFFYPHNIPKISGLAEAQRVLEKAIETAQGKNSDGVENLVECLREMTQEDA
ncbi:protein NLRC3-like [Antennarius striatus]